MSPVPPQRVLPLLALLLRQAGHTALRSGSLSPLTSVSPSPPLDFPMPGPPHGHPAGRGRLSSALRVSHCQCSRTLGDVGKKKGSPGCDCPGHEDRSDSFPGPPLPSLCLAGWRSLVLPSLSWGGHLPKVHTRAPVGVCRARGAAGRGPGLTWAVEEPEGACASLRENFPAATAFQLCGQ